MNDVYYEREYSSLEDAQYGHKEAVGKLFAGNLRLKRFNQMEELLKAGR